MNATAAPAPCWRPSTNGASDAARPGLEEAERMVGDPVLRRGRPPPPRDGRKAEGGRRHCARRASAPGAARRPLPEPEALDALRACRPVPEPVPAAAADPYADADGTQPSDKGVRRRAGAPARLRRNRSMDQPASDRADDSQPDDPQPPPGAPP